MIHSSVPCGKAETSWLPTPAPDIMTVAGWTEFEEVRNQSAQLGGIVRNWRTDPGLLKTCMSALD